MKKLKRLILILLIWITPLSFGQVIRKIEGLVKPESFVVDNDQLYIADGATVKIYKRDSLVEVDRFGGRGNGPKEFALFPDRGLRLFLKEDMILVNSRMKLSFWHKNGKFIRSIKPRFFSALYIPLGRNYVGSGRIIESKIRYKTVMLYNDKLEPIRELMRSKELFQSGKGLWIGGNRNHVFTAGDRYLYGSGNGEFEIEMFNASGDRIRTIRQHFRKIDITTEDQANFRHFLKTDPKFKEIYPMLKPVRFGDYFPIIDAIKFDRGLLYVFCFSKEQEQLVYQFSREGIFKKRLSVPLQYKNVLRQPYPFVVFKGELLQLVENEMDETWVLHIHQLK